MEVVELTDGSSATTWFIEVFNQPWQHGSTEARIKVRWGKDRVIASLLNRRLPTKINWHKLPSFPRSLTCPSDFIQPYSGGPWMLYLQRITIGLTQTVMGLLTCSKEMIQPTDRYNQAMPGNNARDLSTNPTNQSNQPTKNQSRGCLQPPTNDRPGLGPTCSAGRWRRWAVVVVESTGCFLVVVQGEESVPVAKPTTDDALTLKEKKHTGGLKHVWMSRLSDVENLAPIAQVCCTQLLS